MRRPVRTTTDPALVADLDDHGQGEALAWIVLALAWSAGAALTAGWLGRTGWAILRDPHARSVAGLPW